MLTFRIIDACHFNEAGYKSADFDQLLVDFGKWSRGGNCRGFPGGHSAGVDYIMDDVSASELDRALCELKEHQPRTFKLLFDFYVAGADIQDLSDRRRTVREVQRRKNYYEASPSRKKASLSELAFQLSVGRRMLWEILRDIWLKESN